MGSSLAVHGARDGKGLSSRLVGGTLDELKGLGFRQKYVL